MATYLVAWNPKKWPWDDLLDMVQTATARGFVDDRWSVASGQIRVGDRVFLIRLGQEPKGIMGSGIVTSNPYPDEHWDEEKRLAGETAQRVNIRFDTLLDPEHDDLIPWELLRHAPILSSYRNWGTQSSGVRLPDPVAEALEVLWAEQTLSDSPALPEELPEGTRFVEGARKRIYVNAYERDPAARRACIAHYGTQCTVCGFDFAKAYGPVGRGLIHIHHLKPLGEIGEAYQVDPIHDLCPVCPNCHATIHRRTPAFSIDEVREMLIEARRQRRRGNRS